VWEPSSITQLPLPAVDLVRHAALKLVNALLPQVLAVPRRLLAVLKVPLAVPRRLLAVLKVPLAVLRRLLAVLKVPRRVAVLPKRAPAVKVVPVQVEPALYRRPQPTLKQR
jgi:hypothetical protein